MARKATIATYVINGASDEIPSLDQMDRQLELVGGGHHVNVRQAVLALHFHAVRFGDFDFLRDFGAQVKVAELVGVASHQPRRNLCISVHHLQRPDALTTQLPLEDFALLLTFGILDLRVVWDEGRKVQQKLLELALGEMSFYFRLFLSSHNRFW